MNRQDQVIAIAEHMGATWVCRREDMGFPVRHLVFRNRYWHESWDDPDAVVDWEYWKDRAFQVPNYLGSLDAMHKVTETLDEQQEMTFRSHLWHIVRRDYKSGVLTRLLAMINATAAQRAEAFLRTIGKWIETTELNHD